METKEPIPYVVNESKASSVSSTVKEFLSELIKTILPRHTVVIILMIIIGYFLFYPSVQNNEIYKTLVGLDRYSPFLYVYFIFGIIYLTGGMFLTWKINEMQEKTENTKAEEETKRAKILKGDGAVENEMVKYLVNFLGVPEDRIKKEVFFKQEGRRMMFDAVVYDKNDNHIAVCESKNLWKFDETAVAGGIGQLKAYMTTLPTLKGGYLFISSNRGKDVGFYNSKYNGSKIKYKFLIGIKLGIFS